MTMRRGLSVIAALLIAVLALAGCARSVDGVAVAAPSGEATAGVDGAGAVRVGTGGPKITIFVDFMCPACKQFEVAYGKDIAAAVKAGRLTVDYRALTFLDRMSASGDYSTRALRAFHAVRASAGDDAVLEFIDLAFSNQPEEGGSTDLTDEKLANLAAGVGADAAADKIRSGSTGVDAERLSKANMEALRAAGGQGTPTVLHDGEIVETRAGWLQGILR